MCILPIFYEKKKGLHTKHKKPLLNEHQKHTVKKSSTLFLLNNIFFYEQKIQPIQKHSFKKFANS